MKPTKKLAFYWLLNLRRFLTLFILIAQSYDKMTPKMAKIENDLKLLRLRLRLSRFMKEVDILGLNG